MRDRSKVMPRKRRRISAKWKMFAILICFVTVLMLLIWIFEIQMLSIFYQSAKFNELSKTEHTIVDLLGDDDAIIQTVHNNSEEYHNDIWVYKISDGVLHINLPMVFSEGIGDSLGSFLEAEFDAFYEKAVENNGTYTAMVPMKNFKESYFNITVAKDNFGSPDRPPMMTGNLRQMTAVQTRIAESDGVQYFIVQRSNIEPLGVMKQTLEIQVLVTGVFLILAAFVFALFMAKFITKPIVKVNEAAKNLSSGRYHAEASVKGYREIEELSDTLNFASHELSKNDELQKEIIANVSHDLRTPLTMIKGYGEVMRDIPGENTPENIQVIIDETTRLTDLVNDMFDLSKIQSGNRKPDMRLFSLTELVRDTLKRYEKLTSQNEYKIEFVADTDISVYADSTMILQVVYNLINNAINYTGADKQISVLQTVSGDTVRISVEDTGEGISKEDIPFIWDRYYKVDKVHRRATVGTGLGLSIVKGILELHNATYGVSSTLGKGSTFWFELKRAENSEYYAEIVSL